MTGGRVGGALLILVSGVAFSFGALVFRETDDIGPWEYLVFRALGALAVTLVVFGYQNRGRHRAAVAAVTPAHLVAGVVLGLMFCTFIVSLTETTAAFIVFFQAASPITAAVFSWVLLRERMSRPARLATVGVLAGVAVMVAGGLDAEPLWVVLLVTAIPVGLGLYATLIRTGEVIDPSVPAIVATSVALVLAVVVTIGSGGFDASGRDMALGLFAGAVLLGLPLPLFNLGARSVPAPEASLLLMSEIVLTPVWVWLFVDETPSDATLVGGTIILAVVVWLTVRTARLSEPPPIPPVP